MTHPLRESTRRPHSHVAKCLWPRKNTERQRAGPRCSLRSHWLPQPCLAFWSEGREPKRKVRERMVGDGQMCYSPFRIFFRHLSKLLVANQSCCSGCEAEQRPEGMCWLHGGAGWRHRKPGCRPSQLPEGGCRFFWGLGFGKAAVQRQGVI